MTVFLSHGKSGQQGCTFDGPSASDQLDIEGLVSLFLLCERDSTQPQAIL